MQLIYDLTRNVLVQKAGSSSPLTKSTAVRGDQLAVSLRFVNGSSPATLSGDVTEMIFVVKRDVGPLQPPILLANAWTFVSDLEGYTSVLTQDLGLLTDLLAGKTGIELLGEVTFATTVRGTTSSQVFSVRVTNDLWQGNEGTPLALPSPTEWLAANMPAASIAAAINAGTQDSTAADTDKLAVTHPAGGWMLLSTLWTWITGKLNTLAKLDTIVADATLARTDAGQTFAGAQAFSGQISSSGSTDATNTNNVVNVATNDARYKDIVAEFDRIGVTPGLGIYGSPSFWYWTLPAGAKLLEITCVGGGGGGGSGRRSTTPGVSGGGGGGSACTSITTIPVASLYSSYLVITVGAGGTAGAEVTAADANGNAGGAGGISSVALSGYGFNLCRAAPGLGGAGGSTGMVTGGGTTASGGTHLGSSGGNGNISSTPSAAPNSGSAPGGGGAGGGVSAGGVAFAGGGPSQAYGYAYGAPLDLPTVGASGGGNATAASMDFDAVWSPIGTGGAGGGGNGGGNGGNGSAGIKGGGGGGGGASVAASSRSGAGGQGGDGFIRIVIKF